jgi:Na+(H+)/acetate symporter ActP
VQPAPVELEAKVTELAGARMLVLTVAVVVDAVTAPFPPSTKDWLVSLELHVARSSTFSATVKQIFWPDLGAN